MDIIENKCKKFDKDSVFDDEMEKKMHLHNIETISVRFHEDVEEVQKVYEIILKRYKRSAKIKDFLSVLVARKVQKLIKIRHSIKKH